jgi:hypothetical protein
MTSGGVERKRPLGGTALAGLGLGLLGLGLGLGLANAAAAGRSGSVHAAITERIVVDWHTGLAIYGFDPVGYFTDARARVGRPEFEYVLGGVTWRFRNEGNRAAFAAYPAVYMPKFGGYDPLGVAQGVAAAGNPMFWLIADQRLYLFHDEVARGACAADPINCIARAQARWPSVSNKLVP